MAEWSKAAASKAVIPIISESRVRIPLPPPLIIEERKEMIPVIDLEKKIGLIEGPWRPLNIAQFGKYVVRLALFQGEYHWHAHEEYDELFLIHRGEITLQVKGHEDLILKQGQLAVVSKGVMHCPKSDEKSYVLLFEELALKARGN